MLGDQNERAWVALSRYATNRDLMPHQQASCSNRWRLRFIVTIQSERLQHRLIIHSVQIRCLARFGSVLISLPRWDAESVAFLPPEYGALNSSLAVALVNVIHRGRSFADLGRGSAAVETLGCSSKSPADCESISTDGWRLEKMAGVTYSLFRPRSNNAPSSNCRRTSQAWPASAPMGTQSKT